MAKRKPPPRKILILVDNDGNARGITERVSPDSDVWRTVAYEPVTERPKEISTDMSVSPQVERLTKALMRKFDRRHHRFLIDYGWQQVSEFVLNQRRN